VTEPALSGNTIGIGTEFSTQGRAFELIVRRVTAEVSSRSKCRSERYTHKSRLHHHGRTELVAAPRIRQAEGINLERSGSTDQVLDRQRNARLLDLDQSTSTQPAARSMRLATGDVGTPPLSEARAPTYLHAFRFTFGGRVDLHGNALTRVFFGIAPHCHRASLRTPEPRATAH
jgi:hypothetical protein